MANLKEACAGLVLNNRPRFKMNLLMLEWIRHLTYRGHAGTRTHKKKSLPSCLSKNSLGQLLLYSNPTSDEISQDKSVKVRYTTGSFTEFKHTNQIKNIKVGVQNELGQSRSPGQIIRESKIIRQAEAFGQCCESKEGVHV
jgi:hypothetical protein